MTVSIRFDRLLPAVLALCVLGAAAAARQISLPPRAEPRGNVAPFVVCSVCAARNYNAPANAPRNADNDAIAWCASCKRDTAHTSRSNTIGDLAPEGKAAGTGNLRLPPAGARPASGSTSPSAAPDPTVAPVATTPATTRPAEVPSSRAADFIFDEVRALSSPSDRLALKAVDSLVGLGEPGLAAARAELDAEEAPVVMTAARVLLRAGGEDGVERVKARVRTKLPAAIGGLLVDELAVADPVRVSPRYLAELLDSSHAGVRGAAHKLLRRENGLDLLVLIEPALASKRADTRLAAIDLAADVVDPAGPARVSTLLLDHIADPSAKVASAVAVELAGRADPELDARLAGLAFRQRWILRESAYALIAIVEREDLAVRAILDESGVEALLAGMEASDPFVAGSCAAALAGIGFRSPDSRATSWLDRDVIDRLVFAISGKEFHNDFSSLAVPALRRLRLVTGQEIGNDGPRWVEWWLAARPAFYARRAHLSFTAEETTHVRLRYSVRGAEGSAFMLLGPDAGLPPRTSTLVGGSAETIYLSAAQCRDLLAACASEGAFGAERLPGTRGARGDGERSLEIAVAGRGKTFLFGAQASEPWFERMVAAAHALRDANRWQRYPLAREHGSPHGLWIAQSEWWGAERTDLERALRLKSLVLAALPELVGTRRDAGIAELERLLAQDGVAAAADFHPLLVLLRGEDVYSERVRRLNALALRSAEAARGLTRSTGADVACELALELANALLDRFGAAATGDLDPIVSACGAGIALALATDPHPALRAVAARKLAVDPTEAHVAALLRLLDDPDDGVEVATVLALGAAKIESARTELLVRARMSPVAVRTAALEAVGALGGEYAFDALVLGVSDADPAVRSAAAKGLAALADPASTQVLISLLGEGPGSSSFEPARTGLLALGARAWPELLRVVHAPAHRARREVALLLAEQGVPDATSALITLLTATPTDAHVASELAVLTGVDLRSSAEPAAEWWDWWDGVVHDDALAWFRAALERADLAPPAADAFTDGGTPDARSFLVGVIEERGEPHLVERARRELGRMLARDLGPVPPKGPLRVAWVTELRASLDPAREP